MNPFQYYCLSDHPLFSVNTEQGPGITIDNELKFSNHAKKSAAGANLTMELIKHTLSTRFPKVVNLLYKGLVQSKLEIGMSLASPY